MRDCGSVRLSGRGVSVNSDGRCCEEEVVVVRRFHLGTQKRGGLSSSQLGVEVEVRVRCTGIFDIECKWSSK